MATAEGGNSSNNTNALPIVLRLFFTEKIKDDGNFVTACCNLCKPLKNSVRGQLRRD